ncbi:MAG TPA: DCC1-like thiol-disulfide oxidoreductase family protein [Bacteroidia bacterium]|jgi:predicted DCC family thiol-disulfide oxidoreductase YuxK|nr:DCC1-like thiol-disulfide oxidoreductase family protein [Bacteroidia bacterium]
MNDEKVILLFDGYCNLCNSSINFILDRDRKDRFRFAALQSPAGVVLLKQYNIIPGITDSIVAIENGKAYLRSSAALRIAANLGFAWNLFLIFYILPPFLRNAAYDFIARNRYRWYGKRETCRLPNAAEKPRFLN